jgi:allantoinase
LWKRPIDPACSWRSFACCFGAATPGYGQTTSDWFTGLPREIVPVKAWPEDKKVAVCFVLYVEVWGKVRAPTSGPTWWVEGPI